MEWKEAHDLAQRLAERLSPACLQIEIAGSLRREKPVVKDIEIVAIARTEADTDLFGEPVGKRSLLDAVLSEAVAENVLTWDTVVKRNGEKYKRFGSVFGVEIALDLFLAEPGNCYARQQRL